MARPSNIRVFPTFTDVAFFAGEDFSCTLTFKNVAEPSPSSSNSSLGPSETQRGKRVGNQIGGPWLSDAGRSASEGVPGHEIARPKGLRHMRSRSTVGGSASSETARSSNLQPSHNRTQSLATSSTSTEPAAPTPPKAPKDKPEGTNGLPNLKIDTSGPSLQTMSSPTDIERISPSPINQIRKLDLHSTVEDDASSDTSSVGPSKPQIQQPALLNNFSPRSSLDLRDTDRNPLPNLRRPSQTRRLPRSPLSRGDVDQYTENLMMGYAQIQGNFMIDEALIHASEFEEVKAKGVVGGKSGGGVVGVDNRRSISWTGLGAFSNLNLGSIFGVNQPSSIAEMRDRASSKAIPILSTPPSILFVDIRLNPGESRAFTYSFKLPRNLPPSHRGRALRISYSLLITTQRPGQSTHQLSTAEIPFRLFANIDGISSSHPTNAEYGHQPKYNLKSPIILLRDQARTSSVKDSQESSPEKAPVPRPRSGRRSSTYSDKPIESSQEDFMNFVDKLLSSLGRVPISASDNSLHLNIPRTPSPSPSPTKERISKLMSREAIDVALKKGSKAGVFEIGKNGVVVAKLTLPRTMYKLGETVEGTLTFDDGPIQCYQVKSALESTEEIEPDVSVRSQSSVYRATRRVHGSKNDFTAFARRVYFSFEIPTGVAPSFETTSVRHHWSLRLEFMTSPSGMSDEEEEPSPPPPHQDLLEPIEENEKGTSFMAVETLFCESFDCHVPIEVLPTNQEIPEDRVGLSGFAV